MTHYWFASTKYRNNYRLALFACCLAFVVIALGAFTRLTNAGLSCPDWPHCYGYLTAPHTLTQLQNAAQQYPSTPVDINKAWTEMTHRYFAGTECAVILILCFSILLSRKKKDAKSYFIAFGLIALLMVQILLGMLTVTEKLKPVIVLSHLLTGISILAMLWWAYLALPLRHDSPFRSMKEHRFSPWLWLGFVIVFAQITLGGWVSTHYAGLACVDFPYCNGKVLPTMQWQQLNSDLITIHMLHRIGAFVTAIYLSVLALFLIRSRTFRFNAIAILSLIALQLTLGVLNIIWLRPVWIALPHQAVAILLLLTMILLLVKAYSINEKQQYA